MVIRENEIFKRLTTVVETALEQLGITGFQVLQVSQPMATSDHACVLISRVEVHRYGWQGFEYEKVNPLSDPTIWHRTDTGSVAEIPEGYDTNVTEKWNYIDEATFQVSAFLPRKTKDTTATLTSGDTVGAIATWMMSPTGIKTMLAQSLQPLRISEIRTPIQQDDSNIPQFNPNFDVRFMIVQQSGIKTPMLQSVGRIVEVMDGQHLI